MPFIAEFFYISTLGTEHKNHPQTYFLKTVPLYADREYTTIVGSINFSGRKLESSSIHDHHIWSTITLHNKKGICCHQYARSDIENVESTITQKDGVFGDVEKITRSFHDRNDLRRRKLELHFK